MLLQKLKVRVRNAARSRGWDLVKGPTLNQFLESRKVDLVIDVGGNKGDYGVHLRRWGYSGRIVSVEPASDPYARLLEQINGDPIWKAVKVAAGSEAGTAKINISKASVFNSFLPATGLAGRFDPDMEIVGTEEVEVRPLDDILGREAFSSGFLKIDTQGFERQVLEGATETLKRCVGVQLELPIGHLYEGVWSYREALDYMDGLGFVLAQSIPTNTFTEDRASVIEFDCVFRRKREFD